MKASIEKELIVAVDNKPGVLMELTELFQEKDINVLGLCCPPEHEWGRIFVYLEDPEAGREALENEGYQVTDRNVIAIQIGHRPGVLAEVIRPIGRNNINIDYLYTTASGEETEIILQPKDNKRALELLEEADLDLDE